MIKAFNSEKKRKEDFIQRTLGEINQIKQMHSLILSLVKNHTRVEQSNIDAESDRKRRMEETEEDKLKKLEPIKTKRKAKKAVSKQVSNKNNKFIGDAS